jgi:hypothetical protein
VLGRRVWSDDEVQKLASQFLCVADEVFTLEHVDSPGSRLFLKHGRQLPPEKWNPGGTKQGVYCMTPDGDPLAAHPARHDKETTIALLNQALAKWREKGLSPKPIPKAIPFAEALAKPGVFALKVNTRDLPLGGAHPGLGGYSKAWNQNWIELTSGEAVAFLPPSTGRSEVPDTLVRKLFREALIDNVRGQSGPWSEASVSTARLSRETVGTAGTLVTVRLEGEFAAREPSRSFQAKLYGKAVYDTGAKRFTSFELVAAGVRTGGAGADFRADEDPSALGVCLSIE